MTAQPALVTVADPLGGRGLALLRVHLEVLTPQHPSELHDTVTRSQALIVRSRTQVTADLLERGRRLRLVARAGIGVDNIDVAAATDRGILVINAPMGNVRSTAEHTIALLFALARRVVAADRAVREGTWKAGYEGVQLQGKRLGLIGIGKVGSQVAAMASALGLEVIAHDPYLPEGAWATLPVKRESLQTLLETADFVSLHVPISSETRGIVGKGELERMPAGAYLINCARGGLVDEDALAAALTGGQLAGAALDVFEEEPVRDSPLLSAPNVILTPHVAASTREAQEQVSIDVAEQVIDFFAGRQVAFPINPSVLEKV